MRTPDEPPAPRLSWIASSPLADDARAYLAAVLEGRRGPATQLVLDRVARGTSVRDVYMHIFQPALYEIGRLWEQKQITIAQEHYCTAITQSIMAQLYPAMFSGGRGGRSILSMSVGGDLHEIGVRMVSDFLEMDGWDTLHVGANTPTDAVIATLRERRPDVLAVSATLIGHVAQVAALVSEVRRDPSLASTKILVGGQPFNADPDLYRRIGADGWARDAEEAVSEARRLVSGDDLESSAEGSAGESALRRDARRGSAQRTSPPEEQKSAREHKAFEGLSQLNNELVNLQRELSKKNQELSQLNDQKNQFVGWVAHDLRTPITAILGYSELLAEELEGRLEDDHREILAKVGKLSHFMGGLVNDILDIAQIEAGKLVLKRSETDLGSLLAESVALNAPLAARKSISLTLDRPPEVRPLSLDALKIEQVLNNLIGNAVKFSPEGTVIRVGLRLEGDEVVFWVADEGPGIPEAERERMFLPFHKASVRAARGERSHGLGLAIVRKIVEGHGGRIWVDSNVGQGSRFSVALPAALAGSIV